MPRTASRLGEGSMDDTAAASRLIGRGQILFHAPKEEVRFTQDSEADRLLNDLEHHPHAFVLGCVMDRQIPAQRAWLIPRQIAIALGTFSIEALHRLSPDDVKSLMTTPKSLHRFASKMSGLFHSAVGRIADDYAGDASRIWAEHPPSAEAVYRFLEFEGVGPKIATMAVNILARSFKVPFADHYSIDISADVHVRRVFGRLGLCSPTAAVEELVYKARALNPTFPGVLDLPCWEIGRNWCLARRPLCKDCYMSDICPTAVELKGGELSERLR